jgi:hypothetical protein
MRFRAQMVGSVVDIPGKSAVEGRPAHAEYFVVPRCIFHATIYIVMSMNEDVQNH